MSELFPFIDSVEEIEAAKELPLCKEIAWNYDEDKPIIENGDFKIIEGLEAVKVWAYKALKTVRYKYEIYSWDHGHELEELVGKGYTESYVNSEAARYIEEALLINPYIKRVSNVQSEIVNGVLRIKVNIDTIYGTSELEVGT